MNTEQNAIEEQVRAIVEQHPEIQLAVLFGSAVRGRLRPDSDLDVGVAAQIPLSAIQRLTLMDELALTSGRPVDLIDLTSASPPLLRQILTQGSVVVKKDPGLYAALLRKLWYDQADLMPGYRSILRRRRKRFAHG